MIGRTDAIAFFEAGVDIVLVCGNLDVILLISWELSCFVLLLLVGLVHLASISFGAECTACPHSSQNLPALGSFILKASQIGL